MPMEEKIDRTAVNEADGSVNWSKTSEEMALLLAGQIPGVGGIVSFILSHVWPQGPSLWESIAPEVEKLVEKKILELELQNDAEHIAGLKITIEEYENSKPPEKGNQLDIAIGKAVDLYTELTKSPNARQLIPLTVVVSHLHLGLLAERQAHGTEIFAAPYNPEWQAELSKQRIAYEDFFRSIYPEWWTWRCSQISGEWGAERGGRGSLYVWGWAKDSLAGREMSYSTETAPHAGADVPDNLQDTFKDAVLATEKMYEHDARAEMASALASTFLLHLYDPTTAGDKPHVDPALAFIELGPFGPPTLGLEGRGNVEIHQRDSVPGKVSSITVDWGEAINGFQLHYTDHDGVFSGGSGGQSAQPSVPDKAHCTEIRARFANGLMFEVEIDFSDGTTAGPYGNAGGWDGPEIKATAGPAYALCSAGYASVPSGTQLAVFEFAYQSLV